MKSSKGMTPKNLLCFSHLRWDFLLQRPQHLLLRFADDINVYFVENPVFDAKDKSYFFFGTRSETLWKMVPHLRPGLSSDEITKCMIQLIDEFLTNADLDNWTFWYYTSSALALTKKYKPCLTIFDCMDEVSMFRRSPEEMTILEKKLIEKADLVFTKEYPAEDLSWDDTCSEMFHLIGQAVAFKNNQRKSFDIGSFNDQSSLFSKIN
jgi:hypothetical protein